MPSKRIKKDKEKGTNTISDDFLMILLTVKIFFYDFFLFQVEVSAMTSVKLKSQKRSRRKAGEETLMFLSGFRFNN